MIEDSARERLVGNTLKLIDVGHLNLKQLTASRLIRH